MRDRSSASAKTLQLNWVWVALLWLVSAVLQLMYLGWLPPGPVLGDEVIINDPAATLAEGHGLRAASFAGDYVHIDRLFAHFPPVYELLQALMFRVFGFSAYTLRLTTSVMSLLGALAVLLLLRRLWRAGWLGGESAFAAAALYVTCAPLIIVQRMARMESTITLLAVTALGVMLWQWRAAAERKPFLSATIVGICLGLCLATHPESIVVVAFLTPAILLCPVRWTAKALTAGWIAAMPVLLWTLTFRTRSLLAVRQFLTILHHVPIDPTLFEVMGRHHGGLPPTLALMVDWVAVLAILVIAGAAVGRVTGKAGAPHELRLALGAGAAIVLLAMTTLLRASPRRYESLLAPLLVSTVLVWHGRLRWRSPAWIGVGVVTALQLATMGIYFRGMLHDRAANDPRRFQALVAELPRGAYVAADSHLWLEMRQQHHPFTVIYPEYDGREVWSAGGRRNPWTGFDGVVVDQRDPMIPSAMVAQLAALHWPVRQYEIGGDMYLVYLNPAFAGRP